jgi:hypothetical protein
MRWTSTGVSINGKLSHLTSHFRSYNLQDEIGWQEIDLEPAQRFAPRLNAAGRCSIFMSQIEDIF